MQENVKDLKKKVFLQALIKIERASKSLQFREFIQIFGDEKMTETLNTYHLPPDFIGSTPPARRRKFVFQFRGNSLSGKLTDQQSEEHVLATDKSGLKRNYAPAQPSQSDGGAEAQRVWGGVKISH